MILKGRDLLRIFFRSFLIQGLWTVQRGQNLGYVYSLWPLFRRLYPRRDDRAQAASAHGGYFSTHPYTVGVLLGVVAGLEEDRAAGGGPTVQTILTVRSAMSGPLAALGEVFFWGTWLPFSLAVALVAGAFRPDWTIGVAAWFLVLFNLVHFVSRAYGLWRGYRWKSAVVTQMAPLRIQRLLPLVAALGVGLVLVRGILAPPPGLSALTGLLWVGVFWGILRLGVRPSVLAVGVAAGGVVYAWARAFL